MESIDKSDFSLTQCEGGLDNSLELEQTIDEAEETGQPQEKDKVHELEETIVTDKTTVEDE